MLSESSKAGLIVDLFAGGGGASTGIEAALGRHVDLALVRANLRRREARAA